MIRRDTSRILDVLSWIESEINLGHKSTRHAVQHSLNLIKVASEILSKS